MSIAGLNQKELVDNSLNQSVETSKTVQSFIGRDVVTITDRSLPTIAKVIGLVAFAGLVSISVGKVLEGVYQNDFPSDVCEPNSERDNALEKHRLDAASGNEKAILNLCEIDPDSILKILKNNKIAFENLKQESNKEKAPKRVYQPDTSLDVCEPNTEEDNALRELRQNAILGNKKAILELWNIDPNLVVLQQILKKHSEIEEKLHNKISELETIKKSNIAQSNNVVKFLTGAVDYIEQGKVVKHLGNCMNLQCLPNTKYETGPNITNP